MRFVFFCFFSSSKQEFVSNKKVHAGFMRLLSLCVPSGGFFLHLELPDLHRLGTVLRVLGRDVGQSLRSVRVRLWNTRGNTAAPPPPQTYFFPVV